MNDRFATFTVLIAKINRNIRKIKNLEMAQFNLRSAHISCLYYLYTCGDLTSTDLCERCEEDKATISRSLDYLEKNGYVVCYADSLKRYKAPFSLTDMGRAVGERISEKINDVLRQVSADLNENDRIVFYQYLTSISNRLERVCNDSSINNSERNQGS